MADASSFTVGPLAPALDRLRWETQYLVDVLHVAGPGSQCHLSAVSLRQTVQGLQWVIDQMQALTVAVVPPPQPAVPTTPPATGGTA